MEEWICIQEFGSLVEAELAQGLLDSAGIESRIQKDDCGGMNPQLDFTRGVQIWVQAQDREEAKSLLLSVS